MLERVWGLWRLIPPSPTGSADGAQAASPGMKYKHYAPKARVVLVKGTPDAYAAYVNAPGGGRGRGALF